MKIMNFKIVLLVPAIALALSSCKKEKVTLPESNDPVFVSSGTFGNESFSMIAGDGGMYMHTMTEIENGVEVFSGELTNGNGGLNLGIYDGQLDLINPVFTEGMSLSPIFAKHHINPIVTLNKTAFSNATYINSIEWLVNDQFTAVDELVLTDPGIYNVTANVSFGDGSSVSLTNDIIVGYARLSNEALHYSENSGGTVTAWIPPEATPIANVHWYLNDSLVEHGDNITIPVLPALNNLRAVIEYNNGVTRTKSIIVDGASNHLRSLEDFTMFEESSTDVIQDFNFKVGYTSNGIFYDSKSANNSNSTIVINSLEYYNVNSAGNKVYKVTADISCNVRADGGTTDVSLIFSTVFGFEVK